MKKSYLAVAGFILVTGVTACGNNSDSDTSTTTTTTDSSTMTAGDTSNASMNTGAAGSNTTYSSAKLNAADSTFVMKAAIGGMTEVQGGQTAQQSAQNDRVKNFGQMMVNDHSKANQQLQSLAAAKGMTLPADLPADKQKMLTQMKSMQGTAFDKHYMSMMVDDHQEDVADFEKQANSASDPDVRSFASQTLPVLKMHLDSAKAINSAIKK